MPFNRRFRGVHVWQHSRGHENDARVNLGRVGTGQAKLHVVVLKLVVETGRHPRLDLRNPELVHAVRLLHVKHVYGVLPVDRFKH